MKLTEHFSLEELSHSSTAIRLGIDNTPPLQVVGNLRLLAEGLELIRGVTGQPLHVDCGYRCEALERILCAKDYAAWCVLHAKLQDDASWAEYFTQKAHPQGFAGDIICTAYGTPLELVRAINASGIKFDKVIVEGVRPDGSGGWVHASFATAMRGVVMSATFDATGTPRYTALAV